MGTTFFEIYSTGRTPQASPEIIDSYVTGRTIIPEFIKRSEIKIIIFDLFTKQIVDKILGSFDEVSEPYGVMFIKRYLMHMNYEQRQRMMMMFYYRNKFTLLYDLMRFL